MFTRLPPVIVVCAVAVALCGCAASPEPADPSPVFTSEADAFAAAEETYRAYVDALNQVDLSDPETFEAVYAWTTGEANAETRRTFSEMHASGWHVEGSTIATLVAVRTTSPQDQGSVELDVCLDVSQVRLHNANGVSVVSPERSDLQSMRVTMVTTSADGGDYLISEITGREGEPTCGD